MTDADKILQIKCRGSSLAQIDELHEFQGDLKALSSDSLKKLEKVLLRHGFSEPIAVWRDGGKLCILNGHQRLIALKSLRSKGYHVPAIPIVEVDAKDAKEAKEKVLALTSQYGELSAKSVSDFMIASDVSLDFLNEHLRMPEVNFGKIQLQESASDGNEDEVPPVPQKVNIKLGDLFVLGRHRLMCGDSTNSKTVEKLFGDEKASVWASDPPYGISYVDVVANEKGQAKGYKPIANDELQNDELKDFIYRTIVASLPHMKPNFAFYMWHAMKMQAYFSQAAAAAAAGILFHRQIIWMKPQFVFGRGQYHWRHELCLMGWLEGNEPPFYGERNQTTVWEVGRENDKIHPTQKPIGIWEPSILNHTRTDEIVYEPFAGSGSNLIACEKHKRRSFSIELEPSYCAVILDRWQKFTGQQAMREDGRLWDEIKSE